ncbi:MAG: M23 family metallopeptidase [Acidobacteria bacterium]|nr:MAG: M23 family metallopeptidase [Acidobacteriota bacterium]
MRFSLALGLGLSWLLLQQTAAAPPVRISIEARAQQPGELILVTVETEQPSSVTGTVFNTEVRFFPTREPTVWQALLGLDVDLQPGEYRLDLKIVTDSGVESSETRMLQVAPRAFATRYLTLPKKYVNPPADVQERIRREAEEVRRIFSVASPEPVWEGQFRRPLGGKVISSFGKRSVLNGQPRNVHAGVDLRAPQGTVLRAPAGGRVVLAKELYFAGNSIILDHGLGLFSQFAHLSTFKVKEGQLVQPGETIGLTGRSGRVEGPHLHWSMRLGNGRIDPMSVLWLLSDGNRARPRSKAISEFSNRDPFVR